MGVRDNLGDQRFDVNVAIELVRKNCHSKGTISRKLTVKDSLVVNFASGFITLWKKMINWDLTIRGLVLT